MRHLGFFAAIGIVLLLPAGGAQYVREDPPGGEYVVGALTWNEGRGGITWTGASSEDPGGFVAEGEFVSFISDPLPRTLHLNASRLLKLDLYLEGIERRDGYMCEAAYPVWPRLYVDGKLIGGADQQEYSWLHSGELRLPDPPAGYGVCRARIAPETLVLPAGSVLNLTLYVSQATRFGMGDGHRSELRIPVFSRIEVPYRYPSYAHGLPDAAPTGAAADVGKTLQQVGGASAGLLAVLALGPAGRRHRTVLVVALCLTVALAGCFRHGPSSGEATSEPIRLQPSYQVGDVSATGFGSILGAVRASDVGDPVAGAHASLLGTRWSTRSDPYGAFVFSDLAPTEYRLHVDHAGFEPFDAIVPVKADLISRIQIDLVPVGAGDDRQRPHPHDYWGQKVEITVVDRLEVTTCKLSSNGCYFSIPPPVDNAFLSVLPGTYDVNVTLDWKPCDWSGVDGFALEFQANHDPSFDNWSQLLGRGPGVPFHIATTWEMEDPGHQRFSTWVFRTANDYYTTEPDPVCKSSAEQLAGVFTGLVTRQIEGFVPPPNPPLWVTIKVTKGTVPLGAPHPDFWEARTHAAVNTGDEQGVTWPLRSNWELLPGWDATWLPDRLVPPDTTRLEIYVNETQDRLVPDYALDLRYRTATAPPSASCWTERGAACDGPLYKHPSGTRAGRVNHWTIQVAPDEADPFYAGRSFWVFGLRPPGETEGKVALADYFARCPNDCDPPISYAMTVIAYRT